jgi:hypothetical protein
MTRMIRRIIRFYPFQSWPNRAKAHTNSEIAAKRTLPEIKIAWSIKALSVWQWL